MYCIIPLAGPDFYSSTYGIKPLYEIDGGPLIKKAIYSRNWYRIGELKNSDIIFVLRDIKETAEFEKYIHSVFKGSRVVKISDTTRGALLSALAGAALIEEFKRPLVVDLVDILYESDLSPVEIFKNKSSVFGILPYFNSINEKYSYLEINNDYVVRTVEKKVISNNASAGTYFFRDLGTFLNSVEHSIIFDDVYSVRNNLFLCPSFNGIIKNGKKVLAVKVENIKDISLKFH